MKGWKAVALFTAIFLLVSTLNFFVLQNRQDLQISSGWGTAHCVFETIFTDKSKGGNSLCKKVRHASKCLTYLTEE